MFKKLSRYLKAKRKRRVLETSSPEMLYGYVQRGEFLKDTRVGSSTAFIDQENLLLEDNVFIGQFNFIEASNFIHIEEGCQITNYISILTHSSHISIRLYGNQYRKHQNLKGYITGKVRLGKYTFVGPHSTIMPETDIGKGCIVSAYSMVRGSFPDFSIIAGNPAKVIGDTREMDAELLQENPDLQEFYNAWAES